MDANDQRGTPGAGLFPVLCVAVVLEAVGVGMLYPLLARIQDAHHLPTYGLGLMSGSNFFAALIGQVGIGRFVDGRRAGPVVVGGMALGVASLAWFGLASSLWAFSAARALGGVSYGVMMPAALRAGTVGVAEERRGPRLGRLSSAQMAGIVFGPLAGTGLAAAGGLRAPFLVLAVATAGVLVVLVALPSTRAPARPTLDVTLAPGGPPGGVNLAGARPRPTSRPVVAVLLLAVSSQLPTGLYDSLWSRLLTDRGADPLLIGLSLTLFGIPFVALAPLGGRLAGRGDPLVWAAGGLCVSAGFMASYGFVPSPILITVLGTFEACAQAVVVPAGYAATARVFPDRWAATGQGWFSGAGTAAAGTAALGGAPVYAGFGSGAVFAGGAGLSVAFAVGSALVAAGGRGGRRGWAPTPDAAGVGQRRGPASRS